MAEEPKAAEPIQLRILTNTTINNVAVPAGRVAKVDAATGKALVEGGIADPAKEAIDYALTENPDVIDATPKPAEADPEQPDPEQPAT